jgi:predicted double-glycine peptidase
MHKTRAFKQSEGFCGPASLKIVLDFLGIHKSEREIVKLGKFKRAATEAEEIVKLAKKLKLKAFIKDNADIKDIRKYVKKKNLPIIVEWFLEDDGHFSVVEDIDKENIYLQDPDLGHLRSISLQKFKRIWFSFPGRYIRIERDLRLRRMIVIQK